MADPGVDGESLIRLARDALAEWNLDGARLWPHSHRENAVFRVEDVDGGIYALRIHRDGYHDLKALESEQRWCQDLAATGLSIPTSLKTRDGRAYATLSLPDSDQSRHVGLVEWIPGSTLAELLDANPEAAEVSTIYQGLGRLIADFHLASIHWRAPAGFKRHAWDAQGLLGEEPFWGRFWEIDAASDDQRAELLSIRNKLLKLLSQFGKDRNVYGMIHADMNMENVLRAGDRIFVIDFDDAGFGWHAFDLAVAVWDRIEGPDERSQFELAYDALIEGYRSRRPDCDGIVERVPLFVLMRTLMLLGWIQDRPETGRGALIPYLLELALAQIRELDLADRDESDFE